MLVKILQSMDLGTYYALTDAAKKAPALVAFMQVGDDLGGYAAAGLMLLLAVLLFLLQGRRRAAQVTLISFVVGVILVEMLRIAVGAHRPDDAQERIATAELSRSFPAREVFVCALVAVLLAFSTWAGLRRTAARLVAIAMIAMFVLWIAMSQLFLGLHFVTDVMGGLFGGLAVALLASRFFRSHEYAPDAFGGSSN